MRVIATLAAAALLLLAAVPASAAQKTGCPVGTGWAQTTVADAAATIWPALIDPSAFPGGIADLEAALDGYDKNDDDELCVKTSGGEDLNPNSHWYRVGLELLGEPIQFFIPSDNNRAASE